LRHRAFSLFNHRLAPGQKLTIAVHSQSSAPLFSIAIDEHGTPTGKLNDEDVWATVEIGHFTTDFTLQDRGQETEFASSSAKGVVVVYERVKSELKKQGYAYDLTTIVNAVSTRQIRSKGQMLSIEHIVGPAIDEFTQYLLEEIAHRFGSAKERIDGLVLAGGGATFPEIRAAISKEYPIAQIPDNPRFAVVDGLRRFGLLVL
jgi:plasmid segregation protein ParM